MPLYEYACRSCGNRYEERKRYEERADAGRCPACGLAEAELCLSTAAVMGARSALPAAPTCASTGGVCGCGRFPEA